MGNKKVNRTILEKKLQDVMSEFKPVVKTKTLDKIISKVSKQVYKSLPKKTFDKLLKSKEQSFSEVQETPGDSHVSIQDLP